MIDDDDDFPPTSDDGEPETKSDDEKVGYCRPPKSGQFKPGQSGNPKGRKKKVPSLFDRLHKVLHQKITVTEHGKKKTLPKVELMLITLVNNAVKGDLKSAAMTISLVNLGNVENTPDRNLDEMSKSDLELLEDFVTRMQEETTTDGTVPDENLKDGPAGGCNDSL